MPTFEVEFTLIIVDDPILYLFEWENGQWTFKGQINVTDPVENVIDVIIMPHGFIKVITATRELIVDSDVWVLGVPYY